MYRIPDTFQADHLYKAMYSLSVMQQYVHLIDALNLTSARLDSFAVVMEQVLSDSCEWVRMRMVTVTLYTYSVSPVHL